MHAQCVVKLDVTRPKASHPRKPFVVANHVTRCVEHHLVVAEHIDVCGGVSK